jgi:hypothetical protein
MSRQRFATQLADSAAPLRIKLHTGVKFYHSSIMIARNNGGLATGGPSASIITVIAKRLSKLRIGPDQAFKSARILAGYVECLKLRPGTKFYHSSIIEQLPRSKTKRYANRSWTGARPHSPTRFLARNRFCRSLLHIRHCRPPFFLM